MKKRFKKSYYYVLFHNSVSFFMLFFCLNTFCTSCVSVEKYNQRIEQPIPVEKLLKDVDYVQCKLEKLHPSLYKYISKEELNFKFDSLKRVISTPMTSRDFFFLISPVVASVRQGHMLVSPPIKRMSKKQQKELLKSGVGPLAQFDFEWIDNKLFVVHNRSKQTAVKSGAEVVTINAITPQDIYKKYRKTYTSDGFNTTYISRGFSKRFTTYLTNEIGINDSLSYVFKQNDSLQNVVISRLKPEKKVRAKVADKPVTDAKKIVICKRDKRIYGYDDKTKLFSIDFNFIKTDSSIAVLKLRDFSKGNFRKAHAEIFEKIQQKAVKTLIIDVRNNPGGRVAEVVDLYSYLTDKNYVMLQNAEVTSKTSLWKLGLFDKIPKLAYPLAALFYPSYMIFSTLRTKKQDDGTFTYSLVGSRERKPSDIHFTGKIYVLINGGSFSASCLLASSLKANENVTFVGEETGGGSNSTVAGLLPVLTLPSSKLSWRIGLMDIKTTFQTNVFGHGIYPDYEIVPTLQDKIENKDPELDWILKDVKSKTN